MNRSFAICEDLLRRGLSVRITTRGSSMFPLIRTGDWITVSPDKDPEIGDLIVFARGCAMVCHRLTHVFARDGVGYYRTRGDNCAAPDDPVTFEQVIGKVISIERERVSIARKILLFLYPVLRLGRLNGVVIPALITAGNILKPRPHNTA